MAITIAELYWIRMIVKDLVFPLQPFGVTTLEQWPPIMSSMQGPNTLKWTFILLVKKCLTEKIEYLDRIMKIDS